MSLSFLPWWGWLLCGLGIEMLAGLIGTLAQDNVVPEMNRGGTAIAKTIWFAGVACIILGVIQLVRRFLHG